MKRLKIVKWEKKIEIAGVEVIAKVATNSCIKNKLDGLLILLSK